MPFSRELDEKMMWDDAPATIGATPADRAGYIEEMARELERLAVGRELERLRELLRLAREEARRRAFG